MYGGEKFSYPDLLLSKLVQSFGSERTYNVSYDLGCKYEAHLKKRVLFSIFLLNQQTPDELLSSKIVCTIPALHAYGHCTECLRTMHPKRVEGQGLADGEGTERFWSRFAKYHSIVKEMGPVKRIEMLEDVMRDVRKTKRSTNSAHLLKQYSKVKAFIQKSHVLFNSLGVSEDNARHLWLEERRSFTTKPNDIDKNSMIGMRNCIQALIIEVSFHQQEIHSRATSGL